MSLARIGGVLDFLLRLAFFAAAPFVLVLVASLFPVTGALVQIALGLVAFLAGDGRYGPFEILKHTAPGVVCDLTVPAMVRGGRTPGPVAWSLLGGLIGAARYGTIFGVMLIVQPPRLAWALLAPGLALHTTFGVLSGVVTWQLVRAMMRAPEQPPVEVDVGAKPAGSEAK